MQHLTDFHLSRICFRRESEQLYHRQLKKVSKAKKVADGDARRLGPTALFQQAVTSCGGDDGDAATSLAVKFESTSLLSSDAASGDDLAADSAIIFAQ